MLKAHQGVFDSLSVWRFGSLPMLRAQQLSRKAAASGCVKAERKSAQLDAPINSFGRLNGKSQPNTAFGVAAMNARSAARAFSRSTAPPGSSAAGRQLKIRMPVDVCRASAN